MAHPDIIKVGFGLDNDKSTLPHRLGIPLVNVLDLDRVFKRYGYGASIGVRAAVALVLGQSFHKSKKQSTSNWALRQLSPAQIRYAANDAHAPAMVYAALPAWESTQTPLPQAAPDAPAMLQAQRQLQPCSHRPSNKACNTSPAQTDTASKAISFALHQAGIST